MSILYTESGEQHSQSIYKNEENVDTALMKESQNASIVITEHNPTSGFIRVNKLQGQSQSNSSSNVSME